MFHKEEMLVHFHFFQQILKPPLHDGGFIESWDCVVKGYFCYERPLLQAWLLPDLNTISNNCVRENSL